MLPESVRQSDRLALIEKNDAKQTKNIPCYFGIRKISNARMAGKGNAKPA